MPLDLALPPEASWHPNLSAEREILIRPDHLGHAVRFFSSLAVACGVGLSLAVISTWEAAGAQPGPIPGSHDNTKTVFSLHSPNCSICFVLLKVLTQEDCSYSCAKFVFPFH